MDIVKNSMDVLIHVDKYLGLMIQSYGMSTYLILFLIIFAETGFVITPFLPGDSLLFTAGMFAALGAFDIKLLLLLTIVAAALGDTVNYVIGKSIGSAIYKEPIKFIKKEHLLKTRAFYEEYGAMTIIIARFIPIIRTFAPFVAGIGEMSYRNFISYNIVGAVMWGSLLTLAGYYFGNLPAVRQNLTWVIMGIIVVSITPAVAGFLKGKLVKHNNGTRPY